MERMREIWIIAACLTFAENPYRFIHNVLNIYSE